MIVLRYYHWTAAILVALILHLFAFLSLDSEPGFPTQMVRGGGLEDQGGDNPDGGAGRLVSLGKPSRTPGNDAETVSKTEETPSTPASDSARSATQSANPAPSEAGTAEQPAEAEEAPPVEAAEAVEAQEAPAPVETAALPESSAATAALPENPVETQIKTPPLPSRKPKAPEIGPDFEPFGRRLSAQGPETEDAQAQAPSQASEAASDATEPQGSQAASEGAPETLAFAANSKGAGRIGNASRRESGRAPELNYEDRVLLWLKRNGAYPREAYRFRQEGVVLLRFIVERSGEIRHYNLVKSSGYYLLDEAVHKMMKRANPVPPIPPEITKAELEFTIPVRFSRDYAEKNLPSS